MLSGFGEYGSAYSFTDLGVGSSVSEQCPQIRLIFVAQTRFQAPGRRQPYPVAAAAEFVMHRTDEADPSHKPRNPVIYRRSVTVPCVVPWTITDAPITPIPVSSTTVPSMVIRSG